MVAVESFKSVQGLGANTVYCGDGINDIAALAAADVGMAIGATDAVVAASLSTSRKSVAGNTAHLVHCPCKFLPDILPAWLHLLSGHCGCLLNGPACQHQSPSKFPQHQSCCAS